MEKPQNTKSTKQPFLVALGLFLSIFFVASGAKVFVLFLPYFNAKGMDMGLLSSLAIVSGISIFLGSTYAHKLYSKFGMKRTMLCATVITAISYVPMAFSTNIFVLAAMFAILGFGTAVTGYVPASIAINAWFISSQRVVLSIVFTGMAIGGALYSLIYGIVTENINGEFAIISIGALTLLGGVFSIAIFVKNAPENYGAQPYKSKAKIKNPKAKTKQAQNTSLMLCAKNIGSTDKILYAIITAIAFIGSGVVSVIQSYMPSFWENGGVSTINSSRLYATMMIIGAVASIFAGYIADKYKGTVFVLYTSIVFIIGTAVSLLFGNLAVLYLAAVLFGIGYPLCSITPAVLMGETYDKETYAKRIGFLQGITFISIAVLFPITGVMFDVFGSFTFAFILMTIMLLFVPILMIFYKKAQKTALKNKENIVKD